MLQRSSPIFWIMYNAKIVPIKNIEMEAAKTPVQGQSPCAIVMPSFTVFPVIMPPKVLKRTLVLPVV